MANSVTCEIWFDSEGFQRELMKRLALTSGTDANIERIAIELINSGEYVRIGTEPDILDAEYLY